MHTENREYNLIGELTLTKNSILPLNAKPKDDKVNWLFLNTGKHQFSFVYKIDSPLKANYDEPFKIKLAFTMFEIVKEVVELNFKYEVLRGSESIGSVNLSAFLK